MSFPGCECCGALCFHTFCIFKTWQLLLLLWLLLLLLLLLFLLHNDALSCAQVNGGVVCLLGYARSELLGSNVRMIVPEPFSTNHGTLHCPGSPLPRCAPFISKFIRDVSVLSVNVLRDIRRLVVCTQTITCRTTTKTVKRVC